MDPAALTQFINQVSPLLITVVVPMIVLALKKALPNVPTFLLPIAAPFLGALGDLVVNTVSGWSPAGGSVAMAAVAGALGVFLRETFDQSRKALAAHAASKPDSPGGTNALLLLPVLALLAMLLACASPPKVPQTADEAIREARVLLTAGYKQVADNLSAGVMTSTEGQSAINKLDDFRDKVGEAERLKRQGDLLSAKNKADLVNRLLTELHRTLAEKARGSS